MKSKSQKFLNFYCPKALKFRLYAFKGKSANFAHFANAFCKFKSKHTLINLKNAHTNSEFTLSL